MNRNLEGKYIIHFIGESYSNDLCLSEKHFLKNCKLKESKPIIISHKPRNLK